MVFVRTLSRSRFHTAPIRAFARLLSGGQAYVAVSARSAIGSSTTGFESRAGRNEVARRSQIGSQGGAT